MNPPITTSVTVVVPFSCLISCFFLSNSPFPRRSLIVSLYCTEISRTSEPNLGNVQSQGTGLPSCTPSLCFSFPRRREKTCPTARGIKPAVSSSYYILLTGSEINRHCIRTIPPSIVKDLFEHIRPSAPKKCNKAHLSASCLTIGKDADIIPINAALSKL